MRFDAARVDQEKIVDYLLGSSSVAAIAKARFFGGMGFSADKRQRFADALRGQASASAMEVEATDWGAKYVAAGPIDAPSGRRCKIVSVWIDDGAGPRRVTAYPAKEQGMLAKHTSVVPIADTHPAYSLSASLLMRRRASAERTHDMTGSFAHASLTARCDTAPAPRP